MSPLRLWLHAHRAAKSAAAHRAWIAESEERAMQAAFEAMFTFHGRAVPVCEDSAGNLVPYSGFDFVMRGLEAPAP